MDKSIYLNYNESASVASKHKQSLQKMFYKNKSNYHVLSNGKCVLYFNIYLPDYKNTYNFYVMISVKFLLSNILTVFLFPTTTIVCI